MPAIRQHCRQHLVPEVADPPGHGVETQMRPRGTCHHDPRAEPAQIPAPTHARQFVGHCAIAERRACLSAASTRESETGPGW